MADEPPSGRIKRFLDYLETISKILGGVSIPIAGLFVTVEPRAGSDRPAGPTVMESV